MKLLLGYVPLTDAAPLIVAAEGGFAAAEGLRLELSREPSWATLRDKLALGHLDGAHILAPLALAMSAGASGARADVVAPFVLNRNGNALTVSLPLWAAMEAAGAVDGDLDATAHALASVARGRRKTGRLRLATVFSYSGHTIQLRRFLARGGLDLTGDVQLTVVPPPEMARALASGAVDAFCVGSPWNGVAVAAGTGRIVAFGAEIAPETPEKVLALPARRLEGAPALVRALQRAADWCADPANHPALADGLASPAHLDLDPEPILRSLTGDLIVAADGLRRRHARYIAFGGAGTRPTHEQELWLRAELAAAQLPLRAGAAVFRPDLYDAAFPPAA